MSLFTEYEFSKCVKRYQGDRHAIKFNCRDQFLIMSFAQFTDRSGLRDIETTLDLCSQDLFRSGLKIMPKSTLAEANEKKDWHIYQDFGNVLIQKAKELYKDDSLRLVMYEDFRDGRVYRFLTNNFTIDAITVAELYRERWQIEIFFKWIKQHLHIKTFYGTSKNAVYTQIWIAVCDYLLLIIAKKQYGLKPSLHTISNSIGQILFKRGDIRNFYNKPDEPVIVPEDDSYRQLTLW